MPRRASKNTNGIPQIPKSIRITGKLLQFVSLSWAARFVINIFETPIRYKSPEREKMFEKSAKNESIYIPSLQLNIHVYSYGYSTKKALLVHGWSGRGTQLYRIADKLLEKGYMIISFDGPGHGKSEGKKTLMLDFIEIAVHLQKKFGPFEIAVGHSFGGQAILNGIRFGLNIKKAVTIGCGDSVVEMMKELVAKLGLKKKVVKKMRKHYVERFGEDVEAYSGSEAAKKVPIPTLVIHDTNDKEIAVSCAHRIRQNLVNGTLLITDQLGHKRILNDKAVIEKIVEFIQE